MDVANIVIIYEKTDTCTLFYHHAGRLMLHHFSCILPLKYRLVVGPDIVERRLDPALGYDAVHGICFVCVMEVHKQ